MANLRTSVRPAFNPFRPGSSARRESAGTSSTKRPVAYTAPRSSVSPASARRKTKSSSAERNSSAGNPCWICRTSVADEPSVKVIRAFCARSNSGTSSASADCILAAAATSTGLCGGAACASAGPPSASSKEVATIRRRRFSLNICISVLKRGKENIIIGAFIKHVS